MTARITISLGLGLTILTSAAACLSEQGKMERLLKEMQADAHEAQVRRYGLAGTQQIERINDIQEQNLRSEGFGGHDEHEEDAIAADLVLDTPLFGSHRHRVETYLAAIGVSADFEKVFRAGWQILRGDKLKARAPTDARARRFTIGVFYRIALMQTAAANACRRAGLCDWPCAPFIFPTDCEQLYNLPNERVVELLEGLTTLKGLQDVGDEQKFNEVVEQMRRAWAAK